MIIDIKSLKKNEIKMKKEAKQPVTHKIVQWGEKKFEGTLEKCREVKKRWTDQHGNIDLDIVPIMFPTGRL